jgi:hypothetical protein
MKPERTAALVRSWVRLYTLGLPVETRQGRRDEIDDDLWCQAEEAAASGRSERSLAGEIGTRLLLGIPADLSWRIDQFRESRAGQVARERSFVMNAPGRGLMAILGGIGWLVWPIPQAYVGRDWPSEGELAWLSWVLFLSVVPSTWLLAGATAGLALIAPDRIRPGIAILASLAAALGAISVLGAFGLIIALPIGSALLLWELGRLGAVSTWQARVHVGAASLIVVLFAIFFGNPTLMDDRALAIPLFAALVFPYAISWIALGMSLYRSSSMAQGAAGTA